MSQDPLRQGKKQSKHKSGAAQEKKALKRKEAEERQAKYAKLAVAQKLAQPTLGAKERKKLLAKTQN